MERVKRYSHYKTTFFGEKYFSSDEDGKWCKWEDVEKALINAFKNGWYYANDDRLDESPEKFFKHDLSVWEKEKYSR